MWLQRFGTTLAFVVLAVIAILFFVLAGGAVFVRSVRGSTRR